MPYADADAVLAFCLTLTTPPSDATAPTGGCYGLAGSGYGGCAPSTGSAGHALKRARIASLDCGFEVCDNGRRQQNEPFWPTSPIFLATGGASLSAPLDVPFVIQNKSGFFALEGIQLKCVALKVSSVDPDGKPLVGVWNSTFQRTITGATNYIAPTKSAPYSCPMGGLLPANAKVTYAVIAVIMQYRVSWPWPNRTYTAVEGFTFSPHSDPPQWVTGLPLQ